MSPKRSDYHQLRANIPKSSYSLLKRLAGVREVTLSELVTLAVDQFLESEEIQEEIRFHRLDSSGEGEEE